MYGAIQKYPEPILWGGATKDENGEYTYGEPNDESDSGGSGCFPASCEVLTPSGLRKIVELRVSDEILSFNNKTQGICRRKIIKVIPHSTNQLWEVRTSVSSSRFQTTATHSFLTSRGWKKTSSLKVGDTILSVSADQKISMGNVLFCRKTNLYEPVYNLITEADHNFIVGGVVAHNFTYFRNLRICIYKIRRVIEAAIPNPTVHGTAFGSR